MSTIEFEEVVHDGILFLESLARYYGNDKAMEIWDTLGPIIGQEIKGQVFFSMLSGDTGSVTFSCGDAADRSNSVNVIKAIRNYTGFSLSETKDIWDNSKIKKTTFKVLNREDAKSLRRELRNLGCDVR